MALTPRQRRVRRCRICGAVTAAAVALLAVFVSSSLAAPLRTQGELLLKTAFVEAANIVGVPISMKNETADNEAVEEALKLNDDGTAVHPDQYRTALLSSPEKLQQLEAINPKFVQIIKGRADGSYNKKRFQELLSQSNKALDTNEDGSAKYPALFRATARLDADWMENIKQHNPGAHEIMMQNNDDFDDMQELLRKTKRFQDAIATDEDGAAKNPREFRNAMRINEPFMNNLKENLPKGYELLMDDGDDFRPLQDFLRKMKLEQDKANGKNVDGPVRRASREWLNSDAAKHSDQPPPTQSDYDDSTYSTKSKAKGSKESGPMYPKTNIPPKEDCGPHGCGPDGRPKKKQVPRKKPSIYY